MRKFVVILKAQAAFAETQIEEEMPCAIFKVRVIIAVRTLFAEPLVFHLFELDRAENKVSGRDLVAECLADLRDPEGNFCTVRS